MQIKSWIIINNHGDYNIDIINNTFVNNTATMGIIMIYTVTHRDNSRILISNNWFIQNAGYIDASVIRIVYKESSTYNVLTRIPKTGSDMFCSGMHFE